MLLLILIPFLVIGIWDFRNFSVASQKMFHSPTALPLLFPKPLDTASDGRTNILLIGYSADDPGHAGARLTDSILILSMNKDAKTGYMLSVPRDLYVDIPGYGAAKINEAYQAGEDMAFAEEGYSSGGIGMVEKVIGETFGMETQYHAIINYSAVRETVDALGGVTVTIQSPDPRGLYDPNFLPREGGPLQLANGPQTIDGATALKLSRARGATYGSYGFPLSDFNRTEHQRQVFAAILDKLSWKLVLDPRANGKIFDAAANHVQTDVTLPVVIPLYRLFNDIPLARLKSVGLREQNGTNLLSGYTTRSGQSALIPTAGINDYSEIQAFIQNLDRE